jgi:hypothetical protein
MVRTKATRPIVAGSTNPTRNRGRRCQEKLGRPNRVAALRSLYALASSAGHERWAHAAFVDSKPVTI